MMFRIGGLRFGRHFSSSIFLICVLEMIIYINICMTEEVMNSEKQTTESYLEREKNNLILWAAPTPNASAEERHKEQMEEAQEALKRAALTKEIEREQMLLEKKNEQQEKQIEVQRPLQRVHFSEKTSDGGEASEGDANGNGFGSNFKNKRTLLSSLDSTVDSTFVEILVAELSSIIAPAVDNTVSLAQVLFHHGIQLFCLWKLRKVVARKLKTHLPLEELYALLRYNMRKPPQITPETSSNTRYCLEMLEKVNGSFAAMIVALPDEFREATCVFYLILRALGTIESDRSVSVEQRKEALLNFHLRLLDRSWSTRSFGQGYNKELLGNFDRVTELFWQQREKHCDIIKDSTRRMGQGMSEFLDKEAATKQDYETYCHYVAGLVGISLTAMLGCGIEEGEASKALQRANNLGLFLQKTNIIYESFLGLSSPSGRVLIPQEIWAKFVDNVQDLKDPRFSREATGCLNELVIDAFSHLHSSLEYMFFIKDPAVFNFFAIPLVLAAATLADCFGNQQSFLKGAPLRKGLAAQIFLEVNDFKSVCSYFLRFIDQIDHKIKKDDPNADGLRDSIMYLKNYIDDMRWVDEMTPHKRPACL